MSLLLHTYRFSGSDPEVEKVLFTVTCATCNEWFQRKCERINVFVFKINGLTETVNFEVLIKIFRDINKQTSHANGPRDLNTKTDYSLIFIVYDILTQKNFHFRYLDKMTKT